MGVLAVHLNHLLRLFVGRGDQVQGFIQTRRLQAQLVDAGDLTDQQTDQHALACSIGKALMGIGRNLARVATLAADLLDLLGQHVAGFGFDQTGRQFDVGIGGDQLLADFAAQAVHQCTLQLTLQVGTDVGAELLHIPALDTEALDELRVHFRQHRFGHIHGLDGDLGGLASQCRHAPVSREFHVQGLFLTLGQADQSLLDRREHHAATDDHLALFCTLGRQTLAIHHRESLHRHQVTFGSGTGHRHEAAALQAQVFDHLLDIGIGHLGHIAHHGQLADVDLAEFRDQVDGGNEIQLAFGGLLDARAANNAQLVAADRRIKAFAQQAFNGFAANLGAKTLFDHLGRHLARAETLDPHIAADFGQTAGDQALQAIFRQGDGQAALQGASGFNRRLHVDSCHRQLRRRLDLGKRNGYERRDH